MTRTDRIKNLIRVARGLRQPDLVLKEGRIVNVLSGEIIRADVAVYDGVIAGVGQYDGPVRIDACGGFITPGFIDAHMHPESTLLSPVELARAVLPRGTTAIVADPHEIANVMGIDGIRYMLTVSEGLPVDFFFMLPSFLCYHSISTARASADGSLHTSL